MPVPGGGVPLESTPPPNALKHPPVCGSVLLTANIFCKAVNRSLQVLELIQDHIYGASLAGAGGGGFLVLFTKQPNMKDQLQVCACAALARPCHPCGSVWLCVWLCVCGCVYVCVCVCVRVCCRT